MPYALNGRGMEEPRTRADTRRRTEPGEEEAGHPAQVPRKQIYLRTVYPLNPGIPHFIDVPGAW